MLIGMFSLDYAREDCLRKGVRKTILFIIMQNFQTGCNFLSKFLKI